MNSAITTDQMQVGYLSISIFTGIRKVTQTTFHKCLKSGKVVTSFKCYFPQLLQILFPFCALYLDFLWYNIIPSFTLLNSSFNNIPWSINGAARHSRSYTELIIDSNPLVVSGFCFKLILTSKLSVLVF